MIIKEVRARSIEDSRGEKTIEVHVNGSFASSPSGKSTGKYETPPFHKKGLYWNVSFLNRFNEHIEINSFDDLAKLERAIKKKAKLKDIKQFGANALFAFECAALKALAKENKKELWELINPKSHHLPLPVGNAVGGGLHSHTKKKPDFQEFLIIPKARKFSDNVKIMNHFYNQIGKELRAKRKNDEGAWLTEKKNADVLLIMDNTRNKIKRKSNADIEIGIDVAASSFYKDNKYNYSSTKLHTDAQVPLIIGDILGYNLFYIEDPLEENDFNGFSRIRKKLHNKLVIGDDLTATHLNRIKKAFKKGSIDAVIVKPNQNGSLLELKDIFHYCKKNNIRTIMSHRSGETMDDALADLAFGFGADYFKAGISTRWREAKLKRMIEIEKYVR